ncbi:hypothetical protein evm_008799 [Chilo suppressalis]|nr:hypothetical protein evm_008799 [Chilo suppressalis]
MSNITLNNTSNEFHDDNGAASQDTISHNMEITKSDEVQKKIINNTVGHNVNINLEDNRSLKGKKTVVSTENEFLAQYIYNSQGRNVYRRDFWVQYVGPQPEPLGAPLDYTPESRNRFVLLVFTLVFMMLLCTAGFNFGILLLPDASNAFRQLGFIIVIPALIIMVGMSYAMACSSCTRVPPCNFICLIITVLCMSVITAFFTTRYKTTTVLYAVLATTVVVVVCMCLACSSFDFTRYLLYVVVIAAAFGAIAMIVMLGMLITGTYIKPLHLVILIIGTLLQVVILTIDLQAILGGRSVELGEDDYALGAYMLYTSIIDIFIKMLQMIGMFE